MSSTTSPIENLRPLVVGEVLFDHFPNNVQILGGAPFNVAWHLQGFGISPFFVSRIGLDQEGDRVRDAMESWGMDTSALQVDPEHSTGQVQIRITTDSNNSQNTQHQFDILPDQAYDFLDHKSIIELARKEPYTMIYTGSLALRNANSRKAILELLDLQLPSLIDINLRAPWWDNQTVEQLVHKARWIKLNDEEMSELDWDYGPDIAQSAQALRERFDLELLILTCGAQGAYFCSHDDILYREPPPIGKIVDTVGAGDAFTSVVILGMHKRWTLSQTLDRALSFAATICGVRGATVKDKSLYTNLLEQWA